MFFKCAIGLVLLWLNNGERPILATFIAWDTTINLFFLRQTTLTEIYSQLVLYEVVNLSVYFSMKRTGSENLPPLNVGHGQKWQTAFIVG